MHSRTLLNLLVVGLSTFVAVEANMVDVRLAAQNDAAIQKRQNTDDTVNGASTSSSVTPPPSSTPPTTTTSSSSSRPTTTSASTTSARPTSTPPPQTTAPPTTSSSSSSSDQDPQTSESYTTITSYITTTDGNGAPTTITTQSTSTATPGLANNGSNSSSGMSTETRNTIIGVVVGVGGAIVLGGLAFVAWRIWGRKKAAEEPDDLMDYPSSAGEKPDTVGSNSMSGRTPFQSTLESYHAPTQVNTASNF